MDGGVGEADLNAMSSLSGPAWKAMMQAPATPQMRDETSAARLQHDC